jgi:hypothetical protein
MDKDISEEVAQEHIDGFIEYYGISTDELPDNLSRAITSSLAKMKAAIRTGQLEIKITPETITIEQNLVKPVGKIEKLIYKEVDGGSKVAMKEDGGDYSKTYQFLGALTGEGSAVITKLKGRDLSLAESLGVVFLQV